MAMIGTEEGCEVEKEEVEGGVSSGLSVLPPELQIRIASFLFAGDRTVFRRLVSKSLTSNLATAIPISPQPHPEIPYLVTLRANNVLHLYHPTLTCSYRVPIKSEVSIRSSEVSIRSSNYGWMLMSIGACNIFFFEPFSRQIIQLPRLPVQKSHASLCFSSPPTSTDCFVLAINLGGKGYDIIRRDKASWKSYSFGTQFRLSLGTVPLIHNDSCYCLGHKGHVGVFDLKVQQPKWNILGNPYPEGLSVRQAYLVTRNNGELLRVLVLDDKKVQCSKFNINRKGLWLEDTGLGNKMLFLSSANYFMGSTDLRGMEDKFYFPMFHEDALLFYCLCLKRYLSFHSNYSSKDCIGNVKDFYNNSAWITPVSSDTLYNTSLRW